MAVISSTGGCGSSSSGSKYPTGSSSGASSSGASGSSSGDDGASTSSSSGLGTSSGFTLGDSGGPAQTCTAGSGWRCSVDSSCTTPTSLTGKVYDPAGANPLYNVVVFIPNDVTSLPAITPGTHTCNTCDVSIGDYVVATQTDATGSFTLNGVPTAKQVPVTVQIGKWRRTTYVDIDNDCASNTVAPGVLHLPGKQADGDMPQMAILTGGCDDLGCFLTGMGIDPSEFSAPQVTMLSSTAPHNGGRLDVYQGTAFGGGGAATLSNGTAGDCTGAACPLWASKSSLEYYDMALFSCECSTADNTKSTANKQALHDWLGEGGKVFASHYQYTWFENSPDPDFQGVASWGQTGLNDTASGGSTPYDIDTTFPKGVTFGKWLGVVNAIGSAGPPPSMTLYTVADSVDSVNSTPPQGTVRWIYDTASGNHPKYMSFGTPIGGTIITPDAGTGEAGTDASGTDAGGADAAGFDGGESGPQYCGKAVFTDLHTSGAAGSSIFSTVNDIPTGCGSNVGKLTPQQKALEFLFFDLSACVTNDKLQPPPPPNPPQ
jgi:hypothetical protein